jgi:plastocyanin
MRRTIVALAIALAVALTSLGSAGTPRAAADPASFGGTKTHAVKRAKAKRCAKQRRAAKRAARAGRPRQRGCGSGKTGKTKKPSRPAGTSPPPAGASATPPTGATGAPPAGPASAPPAPVVSTLGVSAYDMDGFLLRLTRTSVAAGDLTVFFRNYDVSDHNLWIAGPGEAVVEQISDTVGEGGGGSRTIAVTAGSWRLFCTLPDHGAMTRTLTVTP